MKPEIIRDIIKLFHTYGIKALSMGDIAQLSGISVKMLNNYFINKETLIMTCIKYRIYQENIFPCTNAGLLDTLLNYAETYPGLYQKINSRCCMDIKKYHKTAYTFLLENINHYAGICETKVSDGMTNGYIDKKTSPGLIYFFLQGLFFRLFTVDISHTANGGGMMKEIILAFTKGISTPKGRNHIDQKLKTLS